MAYIRNIGGSGAGQGGAPGMFQRPNSIGFRSPSFIGESDGTTAMRTAYAKSGVGKPQNIRAGNTAIHDVINENSAKPESYATPPFKGASKGRPAPGTSRTLARNAELEQKRQGVARAKLASSSKVKGGITRPAPKQALSGPKSAGVSKVDDLFGVSNSPMGYM
jgi:hypothetical protein